MKKNELNLNVIVTAAAGKAEGTTNWFLSFVEKGRMVIDVKSKRDGGLALYFVHPYTNTAGEQKESRYLICEAADGSEKDLFFNVHKINDVFFRLVKAESRGLDLFYLPEDAYLFECVLTPRCKDEVEKFIWEGAKIFADWFVSQ